MLEFFIQIQEKERSLKKKKRKEKSRSEVIFSFLENGKFEAKSSNYHNYYFFIRVPIF